MSEPRAVPGLVADPEAIADFAACLLAVSAQLDDVGSYAAGAGRLDDWHGEAAAAYRASSGHTGRRADAMSLALRAVAWRAEQHAAAMRRLLAERDALVGRRARLLDDDEQPVGADGFDADVACWEAEVAREEGEMAGELARHLTLEGVDRLHGDAVDPADAALATMPGGVAPEQINAWWERLTDEQRESVAVASPGLIGNLEGVPSADRDAANRVALDRDLGELGWLEEAGLIAGAELALLASALAAKKALDSLARRTDPVTGRPVPSMLLGYDPKAFGGDGSVTVAVGDPDQAEHVVFSVPGLTTDASDIAGQVDRAVAIHDAARTDDAGSNGSVAVIAWIDYDCPQAKGSIAEGLAVTDLDLAAVGGDRLDHSVDGLLAVRPDDPHVTLLGHSYGSTTVAMAGMAGVDADELVLTGSPGVGTADHASELPGDTWVLAASSDPVTWLGGEGWVDPVGTLGLGHNPADHDFGADRLQAEPLDRSPVDPLGQHTSYFDPGSESLHNIAQVVNGDHHDVLTAPGRDDPWWGPPRDPEAGRVPTRQPIG